MSAHLSEAERGMGQMAFLNGVPVLRMYSEADVEAILAARVAAAVAAEREAWASYFEGWISAVGPEPPTPEAMVAALRSPVRPFGCEARS